MKTTITQPERLTHGSFSQSAAGACSRHSRVALLTPYTGGNLGDATIQDALIANLRLRIPGAQFSGISLNCENFRDRHGTNSFPLCGFDRPFYGMARGTVAEMVGDAQSSDLASVKKRASNWSIAKQILKKVPGLAWCLKSIRFFGKSVFSELWHCVQGYRFLRTQDLLVVSGGGQLDEEWGGPWAHPFSLAKWAILARIARVPCAIASVGACKTSSATCRIFLSTALRLAQYRSYRDRNSKQIAVKLLGPTVGDPIVPDLAFSIPLSELPPPAGIRSLSPARLFVAVGPIAYAKPGVSAYENPALFSRYLQEMARVTAELLRRDYFIVIVSSSIGDDDRVIHEILELLDNETKEKAAHQMHIPRIRAWQDLVAVLRDVDLLIAGRLHTTILGFVAQIPTVAISFDPKVDWVMEDLGQIEYLLQIRNFKAEDVMSALDRIKLHKDLVAEQLASYRQRIIPALARQYDALVEAAGTSCRHGWG